MKKKVSFSSKIILLPMIFLFILALLGLSMVLKRNTISPTSPFEHLTGTIETDVHKHRLKDRETPYSLCFENTDGSVSMYIFATPISYYDSDGKLQLIDTRLKKSSAQFKRRGYVLETKSGDIKCYFPKNLALQPIVIKNATSQFSITPDAQYKGEKYTTGNYTDSIGRMHDSVSYSNDENMSLEYVPTSAGIMLNITLHNKPRENELVFYIGDYGNATYSIDNNQYVILEKSEAAIIFQTSYLQDSTGATSFMNEIRVEHSENQVKYTIKLDESFINGDSTVYPLSITPSFEFLRNSIPDSAVSSENPTAYRSNYAALGTSQHYMKARVNYLVKSYAQNVKSASYYFQVITAPEIETTLELQRLRDFWYSSAITWENKPNTYAAETSTVISKIGNYNIDVSNYIKACLNDDTFNTEEYGIVFSTSEQSFDTPIIASYDNTFYQPYFKIDFYTLPWTFENIQEINPDPNL